MDFKNLYLETKENLELALLSLWSPAHHRMRSTMKDLIKREPLFAEPVFQSMFPWKNTTDPNWRTYIKPEVIEIQEAKAEEKGYIYTPFEHQAESWKELEKGNSIVVTSGTGSGKTECFMLPVLSDIYSRKSLNGNDPVEAIFLYPLNALMQDQKDRLGSDCQKLGLKFAVYNRSLKDRKATEPINPSYPDAEVRTRNAVREQQANEISCPQILLTNPSMLEYMLVRDRDQSIFSRSQGKLKWIVIDEAHTYTGSAAIELAYLIKRVLSAFNVDRSSVKFVCTSATIGDPGKPQELLDFIETIIGKVPSHHPQKLVHIDGERVVPSMNAEDVRRELEKVGITHVSPYGILKLREDINRQPMSLSSIWNALTTLPFNNEHCLDLLDKLCEIKIGNDYLMMIKGHFFMRTINGLYACVNQSCSGKNDNSSTGFSFLTTHKGNSRCPHCGAPLIEVVQCGDCKEFMLVCEENDNHEIRPSYIQIDTSQDDNNSQDDDGDNSTDGGVFIDDSWQKLYLSHFGNCRPYTKPHPDYKESKLSFNWDGFTLSVTEQAGSPWYRLANDDKLYCPNCVKGSGEDGTNFSSFRVSANWVNGVIAPALLKEGQDTHNNWGKYIAFTDSRQGTAINAKRFNIDSERSYSRNRLVAELCNPENNPQIKKLKELNLTPVMFATVAASITGGLPVYNLRDVADCIFNKDIFEHIDFDIQHQSNGNHSKDENAYKSAILRSHVGRRPMHLASHESLGLITISYPKIASARCDNNWTRAGFSDDDFRTFLKICIDYHIRMGNHIQSITGNEVPYLRDSNISTPYNPVEWPNVQVDNGKPRITQNRLILLLCAALGINDIDSLRNNVDKINGLMEEAWKYLSSNLLTKVNTTDRYYEKLDENGDHEYEGRYYLDMSIDTDKCTVKAAENIFVCPFSYQLVDTTFRGYSPVIKGAVCKENFDRYKINNSSRVDMPILGQDEYTEKVDELVARGIWTDRHKYAYQAVCNGYLTAEHSGQQDRRLLDHYTKQFKSSPHKLNLLQCSTTMEMGVDIGDIDTVLMTSVPPTSANYLQRAGRAGRRGQSKAVALSLCPHTSIGIQAFKYPMRNLVSRNPAIQPVESPIIVQRHMNSFFVRECITELKIKFNIVSEWLLANGLYVSFISWLDNHRTDSQLQSRYETIFGSTKSLTSAMDITKLAIYDIANDFQATITNIEQEIQNAYIAGNQAKIDALSIQETALLNQELKGFLAEKQFLPNADMPTGVVEFNHIDAYNYTVLNNKIKELERKRKDLNNTSLSGQANNISHRILELEKEIEDIKTRTVTSREIKVALSEYAPGQMVVINERNFVSAGIEWNNSYGQRQPWKYFYHCPVCGRFEYTDDPALTNCACGSLYRNLLSPNTRQQHTLAIEPIRFRTDVNRGINRKEHTIKTYYQIQTILTNVEWGNCINGPQCDIIGSNDAQGEIVFYNVGNGAGFSLCLDCGKMEVGKVTRTTSNWPHMDITQKDVACPVNHPYNGILLSGKFPTSFVSLRFYKDASRTEFVSDIDLLYSLGVILCRSLVQIIGVSNDEIDFDVRQERNYASIYIYDTTKGGCGYSTELLDNSILNATFNKAKELINSFTCHCEQQVSGACVQCLVDRNSQRHEKYLSKHKLMAWFAGQTMSTSTSKTGNPAIPIPIRLLTTNLYSKTSKTDFIFCTDATDMNILDWSSKNGVMGRIIHECINRGKNVTILVANVPSAANGAKLSDIVPFIGLESKFPNCTVKAIKSIESTPGKFSALIVNNREHYYTETEGVFQFNELWGENCTDLYEEFNIPSFQYEVFPDINDAIRVTQPDEITRSLTITDCINVKISEIYALIKKDLLVGDDDKEIRQILSGKKVDIRFSDTYVNSALAALVLVYFIKEIKETYNFEINSVSLQIQGDKRKCNNINWNLTTWASWSFLNASMADNYIRQVFNKVLKIDPDFSPIRPDHCRWLRFKPTGEEKYMEIRPDHGILGAWQANYTYGDLGTINEMAEISTKPDTSTVYYIIYKK